MQLDRVFEALASGPRRQILAYLSGGELSTSALAERFNMSAPAISRHLSVLELAGLVSSERQGQFVLYRLNSDNLVNSLTGYALEVCPVGRPLKQEAKARASAAKAAAPSTPARTAKVTKAVKTVAAAKRAKPAKG
ncbi:metalloregulator ArsR/SmtB family transcription factor [Roseateles sp. UC29_93]|uniref:metalloregulator ArsR/SmtB family transcription factor n=1 Tax=Roseateles sp. UC29_93 TaxID=3350177 RepID=UPI00366EBFDF